jgi:phage/plasmid-like protein (TIGR03299 family)
MAHELNFNSAGKASMAYAGDTPWHGLGQQLTPDAPLDVWTREAGLDWEVKKGAIAYEVRDEENNPVRMQTVPARWALYRSDTGEPLSVMSSNYHITQPRAVMEFFRDLTEGGDFKMETAGVLRNGSTYWALAKAEDSFDVGGGDVVLPYLLLATSCDGSMSNTAQFTTTRVVCNNTLSLAVANKTGQIRVPHSTQFNADKFKAELGLCADTWSQFKTSATSLSKRKVSKEEAARYFLDVFYGDEAESIDVEAKRPMIELVTKIYLDGVGQRAKTAQGTAWGLLNAVTRFADHERKAASRDTRLQSAWFGAGARLKRDALTQAMALV